MKTRQAIKVVSVNCPHCKAQKFVWVISARGSDETCLACHKTFAVKIATKET